MLFSNPILDLIRGRKSVRTYEREPVPPESRQALESFLGSLPGPPFGSAVRLLAVSADPDDPYALKGLGTYGIIRNPAGFIIGAVQPSDDGLFDFGFLMEAACLKLLDLGLGSCWLGGSFRKSRFAGRIGSREGEIVPSVLSFGVPSGKKSWIERVVTAGAGSAARLPFEDLFFDGDFSHPLTAAAAGTAAVALESVRLGPSASNRQPWRIVRDDRDGSFHFFLRMSAAYQRQLKWVGAVNLQAVDMGIAACHFSLAAEATGLKGRWRRVPGPPPSDPDAGLYVVSWSPAE
ncbi:nitroreductase [bacterium]|nr:nitroreductase [bacterium]